MARAIDVSELAERACPGGLGVEALRLQRGCLRLEVKPQLLLQVVSHVLGGPGVNRKSGETSVFHRALRPDRGP